MKKKKIKKDKGKKKDKEDTLTKILILIIFIIIVFYVPDLWKTFDITTRIKRALWELGAEDNLEAKLDAIEGEEYLFIQGFLRSKCNKTETKNHCPLKVFNANTPIYFDKTNAFYYHGVPMRLKILNGTPEDISFKPDEVSFVSFLEKDSNKRIKFEIQDYILKTNICKDTYLNGTICPIKWKKEFKIENITKKRKDISVELTKFDAQIKNVSTDIEVQGRITGNLIKPFMEIRIYTYAKLPSNLDRQEIISLIPENDYYTFYTRIIIPTIEIQVAYNETYETAVEDMNFTKERRNDYLIFLLFQDQNYFYAKEKIIQKNNITEKTYK